MMKPLLLTVRGTVLVVWLLFPGNSKISEGTKHKKRAGEMLSLASGYLMQEMQSGRYGRYSVAKGNSQKVSHTREIGPRRVATTFCWHCPKIRVLLLSTLQIEFKQLLFCQKIYSVLYFNKSSCSRCDQTITQQMFKTWDSFFLLPAHIHLWSSQNQKYILSHRRESQSHLIIQYLFR